PHPPREARHRITAAIAKASAGERRICCRAVSGDAVQRGEEREVLASRELGVEKEIVAEDADRAPKRRASLLRGVSPVADLPLARAQQRREHREHRRLARAVRAEEAENRSAACLE